MEDYISVRRILFIALTMTAAGVCFGSPAYYSGSLSAADGGLTAFGGWDCPSTTLSWAVDNTTTPGMWHYSYSLTVPYKEISHMIIEVSDGDNPFTESNLFSPASDPAGWIGKVEVQNFSPGGSTPHMPESMYGIKFDGDLDSTDVTVSFDSDRRPVWGDFYSKDGMVSCLGWTALYNSGFTINDFDPAAAAANGSLQNHLLVPDSYIPAPAGLLLVCIGTIVTGAMRKRRMI